MATITNGWHALYDYLSSPNIKKSTMKDIFVKCKIGRDKGDKPNAFGCAKHAVEYYNRNMIGVAQVFAQAAATNDKRWTPMLRFLDAIISSNLKVSERKK